MRLFNSVKTATTSTAVKEATRAFRRTPPLTQVPSEDTHSAMASVMKGSARVGRFGLFVTNHDFLAATNKDGAVLLAQRSPNDAYKGDLYVHKDCKSAESFLKGY